MTDKKTTKISRFLVPMAMFILMLASLMFMWPSNGAPYGRTMTHQEMQTTMGACNTDCGLKTMLINSTEVTASCGNGAAVRPCLNGGGADEGCAQFTGWLCGDATQDYGCVKPDTDSVDCSPTTSHLCSGSAWYWTGWCNGSFVCDKTESTWRKCSDLGAKTVYKCKN